MACLRMILWPVAPKCVMMCVCDINYAKELNISPLHPTQVCAFIHFQGLNAAVEMFTVVYTVTQTCTIALTITKLMLLRKSEKKIR